MTGRTERDILFCFFVKAVFADLAKPENTTIRRGSHIVVNQLMRYARSEKRKAYRPATKGINASRYPHAVFYSKTPDGTLIIEGVIYHFSKPVISQRKADSGNHENISYFQDLRS